MNVNPAYRTYDIGYGWNYSVNFSLISSRLEDFQKYEEGNKVSSYVFSNRNYRGCQSFMFVDTSQAKSTVYGEDLTDSRIIQMDTVHSPMLLDKVCDNAECRFLAKDERLINKQDSELYQSRREFGPSSLIFSEQCIQHLNGEVLQGRIHVLHCFEC